MKLWSPQAKGNRQEGEEVASYSPTFLHHWQGWEAVGRPPPLRWNPSPPAVGCLLMGEGRGHIPNPHPHSHPTRMAGGTAPGLLGTASSKWPQTPTPSKYWPWEVCRAGGDTGLICTAPLSSSHPLLRPGARTSRFPRRLPSVGSHITHTGLN